MFRAIVNKQSGTVVGFGRDRGYTAGETYSGDSDAMWSDAVVAKPPEQYHSLYSGVLSDNQYDSPQWFKVVGGAVVERTHDELTNDPVGDMDQRKIKAIAIVQQRATDVVDAMVSDTKKLNYIARALELTDKVAIEGTPLTPEEEGERQQLKGLWAQAKIPREQADALELQIVAAADHAALTELFESINVEV